MSFHGYIELPANHQNLWLPCLHLELWLEVVAELGIEYPFTFTLDVEVDLFIVTWAEHSQGYVYSKLSSLSVNLGSEEWGPKRRKSS